MRCLPRTLGWSMAYRDMATDAPAMVPKGFSIRASASDLVETNASRPKHLSKSTAYIALGSNIDDRVSMIEEACRRMRSRGINVKRTSSLWETKPMYVVDQGNFLNAACEVSRAIWRNHHCKQLISNYR